MGHGYEGTAPCGAEGAGLVVPSVHPEGIPHQSQGLPRGYPWKIPCVRFYAEGVAHGFGEVFDGKTADAGSGLPGFDPALAPDGGGPGGVRFGPDGFARAGFVGEPPICPE